MGLKSNLKYWVRQFPFIYPAKIIDSCQEWIDKKGKQKGIYFSQRGPWYKPIFPAGFVHNSEPKTLGIPVLRPFNYNRSYPTNKATLFYLQNSYLLGHKGLVLTASHQLFQEFSHHFGISSLKKFLWRYPFYTFSAKVKHIEGVGAVLISPESHNYYHWLSDVLPRIKLYESVLDQVDHFCIASNVPVKFLDVLKDFGIPNNKILFVKSDEKLHFDHLFVASLPGSEGRAPQWAVEYLREKLVKTQPTLPPDRKLYFRRGMSAARKILNEDVITNRLADEGFEIVDPGVLSVNEQIEMAQQAKIIISAHGAALSNLLFTQEKIAVIEIFSPDYFRTDCFYTLSSIRNLNYWYLVGDKPAGAAWGDIVVPEDLLFKTIQQLNGG
ncbi:MAG TPA: glycosyltransferase family 61 protein [Mucilaginibacter sp.]|jgi:hypothetical protein|nr:glycosyltransferase family 61 protein [Mucilaginibacter sp.]